MSGLFTTILYQPFFNVLVFFYWLIGQTPLGYDMGVAVILLTLLIRFLLLPVTMASDRSESERREIHERVLKVRADSSLSSVEREKKIKVVLRGSPRILFAEAFMFLIQLAIALILWRIFATGLEGADIHLLYSWIPKVPQPYNLMFIHKFDLSHPDLHLNLLQSLLIFILETMAVVTSPYKVTRDEVVRVQLILPIVSFGVFAFLPAGKKLFVITTLSFSIVVILLRHISRWFKKTFSPPPEEVPVEGEVVVLSPTATPITPGSVPTVSSTPHHPQSH